MNRREFLSKAIAGIAGLFGLKTVAVAPYVVASVEPCQVLSGRPRMVTSVLEDGRSAIDWSGEAILSRSCWSDGFPATAKTGDILDLLKKKELIRTPTLGFRTVNYNMYLFQRKICWHYREVEIV